MAFVPITMDQMKPRPQEPQEPEPQQLDTQTQPQTQPQSGVKVVPITLDQMRPAKTPEPAQSAIVSAETAFGASTKVPSNPLPITKRIANAAIGPVVGSIEALAGIPEQWELLGKKLARESSEAYVKEELVNPLAPITLGKTEKAIIPSAETAFGPQETVEYSQPGYIEKQKQDAAQLYASARRSGVPIVLGNTMFAYDPNVPSMSREAAKRISAEPLVKPPLEGVKTVPMVSGVSAEADLTKTEEFPTKSDVTTFQLGQSIRRDAMPYYDPQAEKDPTFQAMKMVGQTPVTILAASMRGFGLDASQALEASSMYWQAKQANQNDEVATRAANEANRLGVFEAVSSAIMGRLFAKIAVAQNKPVEQVVQGYAARAAEILGKYSEKYPRTSAVLGGLMTEVPTENIQELGADAIMQKYWGQANDYWNTVGNTTLATTMGTTILSLIGASIGLKLRPPRQVKPVTSEDFTDQSQPPTQPPPAVNEPNEPGPVIGSQGTVHPEGYGVQDQVYSNIVHREGAPFEGTPYSDEFGVQEPPPQVPPITTLGPSRPLVSPPIPTGAQTRTTGVKTDVLPTIPLSAQEVGGPVQQSSSPLLTGPVQDILGQAYQDRRLAEVHAQQAEQETGRRFFVWGTERGFEVRTTPQFPTRSTTPSVTRRLENATTIRGDEGQVSQPGVEREESQTESRQDIQQQTPGTAGDEEAREANEARIAWLEDMGRQFETQAQEQAQTQVSSIITPTTQEQAQVKEQVSIKNELTNQAIGTVVGNEAGFGSKLSAGVQMAKLRKQFPNAQVEVTQSPDKKWRIQPKSAQSQEPVQIRRRLGAKPVEEQDAYERMLSEEGLGEDIFTDDEMVGEEGDYYAPSGSKYEGMRITKLFSFDPTSKTYERKIPFHGTDIDKLEGILKDGLKKGSALDYSKSLDWVSDYPIRVVVKGAEKGEFVSHNKYYKSANTVAIKQVIVDLEHYSDQGTEDVLATVARLQKQFPSVKFTVLGEGPTENNVTKKNVVRFLKSRYGDISNEEALDLAEAFLEDFDSPSKYDTYKGPRRNIDDFGKYLDHLEALGEKAEVDRENLGMKLYSIDPLAQSDQLWRSKMIEQIDSPKFPDVLTKDEFLSLMDAYSGKTAFEYSHPNPHVGDMVTSNWLKENKGKYPGYIAKALNKEKTRWEVSSREQLFKREEWDDTLRMTGFGKWLDKLEDQPIPKNAILDELQQYAIGVEETSYGRSEIGSGLKMPMYPHLYFQGGRDRVEFVLHSPQAEEVQEDESHFAVGKGRRQIGFVMGETFTDSEGDEVLVIDTVQSPRHQMGADKKTGGYRDSELRRLKNEIAKLDMEAMAKHKTDENYYHSIEFRDLVDKKTKLERMYDYYPPLVRLKKEYARLSNEIYRVKRLNAPDQLNEIMVAKEKVLRDIQTMEHGIPDAPFRKSHITLLLRRMIRYAAERGIKKIAWTTGEQQATRWGLRQVADDLEFDPQTNTLRGRKNDSVVFEYDVTPDQLPQWVGGDVAKQLTDWPNTRVKTQEGVEYYTSKWPQKIYGFEGEYHSKSLIGNAMKEAMKPWGRAREVIVRASEQAQPILKAFSVQPGIELSDEQIKHYTSTPMYMYSIDPLGLSKWKGNIFDKLPGGGALSRTANWWNRHGRIPSWLAKFKENFSQIYNASTYIAAKWDAKALDSVEVLDKWYDLSAEDQAAIKQTFLPLEGQKLATTPTGEIQFTNGIASPDSQHQREYEAWLRSKNLSDTAVGYLVELKRSSNQDICIAHNWMKRNPEVDQTQVEKLAGEMGFINNYMPHNWYGNHYLEGKNAQGEVVARIPFHAGVGAKIFGQTTKAKRMLKKLNQDPQYAGVTWDEKVHETDELERFYINVPISVEVVGWVFEEAANKLASRPEFKEAAEKLRGALAREVVTQLKTKGFSNLTKRRGVMGYEKDDFIRAFADYKMGLYGTLKRMELSRELSRKLLEMGPINKQDLGEMTQFMEDILAPKGRLDTLTAKVRELLTIRYLAYRLRPGVTNLSNQITTAIPTQALHVGALRATASHTKAANDITAQFAREVTQKARRFGVYGVVNGNNTLTSEELEFIKKAQETGVVQPQMLWALMDRIQSEYRMRSKIMGKVLSHTRHWGSLPMAATEWYSRTLTMLAAGRNMSEGKIVNKNTLERFGLQPGEQIAISDPRAFEFAKEVVLESHGDYTSPNRPPLVRTGRIGKVLSVPYTFKFFPHNMLELWASYTRQGVRGAQAFGLSVFGQVLTGGLLRGFPMASVIIALYSAYTKGDDLEDDLRAWMGDSVPDDIKDGILYGLPAIGLDIGDTTIIPKLSFGGSIEMTLPDWATGLITKALTGHWPMMSEDVTSETMGVLGATIRDVVSGFNAYAAGNKMRAIEYVVPMLWMRDILSTYRLQTEGQYSVSGKPIVLPPKAGEPIGPIKLNRAEGIAKSLGGQPLKLDKSFRLGRALQEKASFRSEALTKLASRFANASKDRDFAGQQAVFEELGAWNILVLGKNKPWLAIGLDEFERAIGSRVKPGLPPPRLVEEGMRMRESMGID